MSPEKQKTGQSGSFLRNVVAVATGAAASQALALLALPLLTRFFSPDQFGTLAFYAGIVGIVSVVSCLRFDNAIPLPRAETAAVHVAAIAFLVLLLVVVFTFFVLYFLFEVIGLGRAGLSAPLLAGLVGAGALGAGLYQIGNYWAVRHKRFSLIGKTRFQQTLASTAAQIGLGLSGGGALSLIFGQLLSQTVGFLSLQGELPRRVVNALTQGSIRKRLHWALRRFKRFPIYDAPAALMNAASAQAPAILFATWFSAELAGYYALSMRLLSAPAGLVGSALSQVLLPKLVESNRKGRAGTIMLVSYRLLAKVSFIPFSVVAALAYTALPELLGASWSGVGKVASWTAIWVAFQFIYAPLSVFLVCVEAQRLNMAIQMCFFAIRFFPLFLIYNGLIDFDPIVVFSVASVLCYVGALLVLARFSNVQIWQAGTIVLFEFILGVGVGVVLWALADCDRRLALAATVGVFGGYIFRLNRVRLQFSNAITQQ